MSGDLLKVLYCSFDVIPEPSGTSARATDFIRGMTPVFNVDGLTVKSADHPHIERYFGMRLMRVPVGAGDLPVRAQTFERAVRRQLESDEYQLVHFTDPYGGYALCEMRSQYNFKLVYEVTGFPSVEVKYTHPHLEGDRRFMSKLRRQELFCLMNADAVLVGSDQTAAMVQSLGVSPDKTTVIRACADCSLFSPISELPLPDRVPMRLLYLGNQNAWQGLSTLLFAMSIAAQLADVRLAIVGPQHPTWRLQLEEMVKYRKLTGQVEFLDPVVQDDLPRVLGAADVGVAPLEKNDRNTVQGAPIVKIAHYLAAARPVIAANLPIAREISNDSCALYYEPGDENDLAEKIVALARDPARRVQMGEKAHEFAKEKLHADVGRTRLLKLYAAMLGAGQTAPLPEAPHEEQSSYAPTSVGEKVLAEPEPENRDAATATFESSTSTKKETGTDPFRRLIAQSAAQMSEPIPDSLAPPPHEERDAAPTASAEPVAPSMPPEPPEPPAPARKAVAASPGEDDLRIDDVDPLEYDFGASEPAPAPPAKAPVAASQAASSAKTEPPAAKAGARSRKTPTPKPSSKASAVKPPALDREREPTLPSLVAKPAPPPAKAAPPRPDPDASLEWNPDEMPAPPPSPAPPAASVDWFPAELAEAEPVGQKELSFEPAAPEPTPEPTPLAAAPEAPEPEPEPEPAPLDSMAFPEVGAPVAAEQAEAELGVEEEAGGEEEDEEDDEEEKPLFESESETVRWDEPPVAEAAAPERPVAVREEEPEPVVAEPTPAEPLEFGEAPPLETPVSAEELEAAPAVAEALETEPVAQELEAEPVAQEIKVEEAIEEFKSEPVVEALKPELVVEEVKAEEVVEELKPELVAEDITAEPVVEELKAEPVVEELEVHPAAEEPKVEPDLPPATEPAFEVISDAEPSPLSADGAMEQLEPEEETTVVPDAAPSGPVPISSAEAIEVVEADLETVVVPDRAAAKAAPRVSVPDVPWDVEPEGEAERQAAIELAASTMPPPEPMPLPEPQPATEEVMVADADLEVVEVPAVVAVAAAAPVPAPAPEAVPEEVFEVEEVIPDAPATVTAEPAARTAPSNIVADFLQLEKPGSAALRAKQNAVTLRMPAFRSTAPLTGAAPSQAAGGARPPVAPLAAPAPAAAPKPSTPAPASAAPPAAAKPPAQAPPPVSQAQISTMRIPVVQTGHGPKPVAPAQPAKPAAAGPAVAQPAARSATPVPVPPVIAAPSPVRPMPPAATPMVVAPPAVAPKPVGPPNLGAQGAPRPAAPPVVLPSTPIGRAPTLVPPTLSPAAPKPWETPTAPRGAAAASTPAAKPGAPSQPAAPILRPSAPTTPASGRPAAQSGSIARPVPAAHAKAPAQAPRAAPPVLFPSGAPRPSASAKMQRPSSNPSHAAEPMVELDAAEVVSVPTSPGVHTPPSGLPASDEWLGHVLLGYAPFNVAIVPRTMSGEIPLLDPAKASANPKR